MLSNRDAAKPDAIMQHVILWFLQSATSSMNSLNDHLPDGLVAHLVEHCTCIINLLNDQLPDGLVAKLHGRALYWYHKLPVGQIAQLEEHCVSIMNPQ